VAVGQHAASRRVRRRGWWLVALVVAAVLAVKLGPGSGGATRGRSPVVSSRSLFILIIVANPLSLRYWGAT
jgi:hypothetical protein